MRSLTKPHQCLQSVSSWLITVMRDRGDRRVDCNPAVLLTFEGLSCYSNSSAKQALNASIFS